MVQMRIALTEEKYLMVGYALSKKNTALHEEKCPMASPAPSTETQYSTRRDSRWVDLTSERQPSICRNAPMPVFHLRESAFFKEKCLFSDPLLQADRQPSEGEILSGQVSTSERDTGVYEEKCLMVSTPTERERRGEREGEREKKERERDRQIECS